MSIKHQYIINEQALKAYKLNGIKFKANTLYTTFKHSELKQLPAHAYQLITSDLQATDVLRLETLPDAKHRVYYDVIEL
ncbi:TPA: hypothetical protein NJ621_004172 [Vibrio parahaemolyticus]|nr:hypothetical protein [Vibrio parahaemolyticus]